MEKKKSIFSYYKPYKKIFFADMFFAIMASIITLVIPLVVRYITSTVIYYETDEAFRVILKLGLMMTVLILFQCYCNYFIANYGHVMGAKIEYDMRAEIFAHYQKLPFSFYDNQKVGQLLSRITSDLFDITELLHHGPENVVISAMKFIGAFVILFTISPKLTFAAFALIPFMFLYAWFFNRKMKKAFARNRVKIADINAQIEDNLSGIRVVKSFANESVEEEKFKVGNDGFLAAKKRQLPLYGRLSFRTDGIYQYDYRDCAGNRRNPDYKSTGQRNRFSYIFTLYQYYDRSGPHDDRLCGDVPERIFRL